MALHFRVLDDLYLWAVRLITDARRRFRNLFHVRLAADAQAWGRAEGSLKSPNLSSMLICDVLRWGRHEHRAEFAHANWWPFSARRRAALLESRPSEWRGFRNQRSHMVSLTPHLRAHRRNGFFHDSSFIGTQAQPIVCIVELAPTVCAHGFVE